MDFSNIDFTSGGLLSLAIVSGVTASDLIAKSIYPWGIAFLALAGVFIFVREYWKVS